MYTSVGIDFMLVLYMLAGPGLYIGKKLVVIGFELRLKKV